MTANLEIREGIKDNSEVVSLISQRKHTLCSRIRTVLARQF